MLKLVQLQLVTVRDRPLLTASSHLDCVDLATHTVNLMLPTIGIAGFHFLQIQINLWSN